MELPNMISQIISGQVRHIGHAPDTELNPNNYSGDQADLTNINKTTL